MIKYTENEISNEKAKEEDQKHNPSYNNHF